jgi:hypothetical protein
METLLASLGFELVTIPGLSGKCLRKNGSDGSWQLPFTGVVVDPSAHEEVGSNSKLDWTAFNSLFMEHVYLEVDPKCIARFAASSTYGYTLAKFVIANCEIKYADLSVDEVKNWHEALKVPLAIYLQILQTDGPPGVLYYDYGGTAHFGLPHKYTVPAKMRDLLDFYLTSSALHLGSFGNNKESDMANFLFLTSIVISLGAGLEGVMSDGKGDSRLQGLPRSWLHKNKARHIAKEYVVEDVWKGRQKVGDVFLKRLARHYSGEELKSQSNFGVMENVTEADTSTLLPGTIPDDNPFAVGNTSAINTWTYNVTFAVLIGRALGNLSMVLAWLCTWNLMMSGWLDFLNSVPVGSKEWYDAIYFACHPVLGLTMWGHHLHDWGFGPEATPRLRKAIGVGIKSIRSYTTDTYYKLGAAVWKQHPDATWELIAHELLLYFTNGNDLGLEKPYQEMFYVMMSKAHDNWDTKKRPTTEKWLTRNPVFEGKANNPLTTYYHSRVLATLCLLLVMHTQSVDPGFYADDDIGVIKDVYTFWCLDVIADEVRLVFKRPRTSDYVARCDPVAVYAFPEEQEKCPWAKLVNMDKRQFKAIRNVVVVFAECPDGEVLALQLPWGKFNAMGKGQKRKKKWIQNTAVANAFNTTSGFLTKWTPETAELLERLLISKMVDKSLLKDRKYTRKDLFRAYENMFINEQNYTVVKACIVDTTHYTLDLK